MNLMQKPSLTHCAQSTCKSAISGSLSCKQGMHHGPFLGVTSWSTGSKLAARMACLVLTLNLLLVMVVMVMVEAGTHLDEPWFRWRDGVVPFYFQARRLIHISCPKH